MRSAFEWFSSTTVPNPVTVHRILSQINKREYFSINRQYKDIRIRFRVDEEIGEIVQKGSTSSGMKHY